jgi:hypothetical protein
MNTRNWKTLAMRRLQSQKLVLEAFLFEERDSRRIAQNEFLRLQPISPVQKRCYKGNSVGLTGTLSQIAHLYEIDLTAHVGLRRDERSEAPVVYRGEASLCALRLLGDDAGKFVGHVDRSPSISRFGWASRDWLNATAAIRASSPRPR